MQAIIQEFSGKADAITAKAKAGEINATEAIAALFGELFSAVAKASAEGVAADLASLQSVGAEKFEISPPGVTFAKEFVMPPLGADGLIGRTYMLKVKKQRSADVADSALYLHKTGSTEADLRSFRPGLILKKAANRQKYKCRSVANSAQWLWLFVGTRAESLRCSDNWDITETCRYFVAKFNDERAYVADCAQWLFQHATIQDESGESVSASDSFNVLTPREIVSMFNSALSVYDEARSRVADSAWWILENAASRFTVPPLEWLELVNPNEIRAYRNLAETGKKEAAEDQASERRRIVASQAWWLFDVEEWTQDELADASVETIKKAQSRCFLAYEVARLRIADYAEFLYLFGHADEPTLRARQICAIQAAGANTLERFNKARQKTADSVWRLVDDGFTAHGIERLIALDFL